MVDFEEIVMQYAKLNLLFSNNGENKKKKWRKTKQEVTNGNKNKQC